VAEILVFFVRDEISSSLHLLQLSFDIKPGHGQEITDMWDMVDLIADNLPKFRNTFARFTGNGNEFL
jgi:hypothetical protein